MFYFTGSGASSLICYLNYLNLIHHPDSRNNLQCIPYIGYYIGVLLKNHGRFFNLF